MGKPNNAEIPLVPGGIPRLQAAELERVVDRIIRTLRAGKPARLPGLGTINPGERWTFQPEGDPQADSEKPKHDR